jgi:hypothetical protein
MGAFSISVSIPTLCPADRTRQDKANETSQDDGARQNQPQDPDRVRIQKIAQ